MLSIDMAMACLPSGLHGGGRGEDYADPKGRRGERVDEVNGSSSYDPRTDAWIKQNQRKHDGVRGTTAAGVAGDHHHFITTLRPEIARQQTASGGPAPAFHATTPKLRGSSARGSFRQPARGRSPVHSAREQRWGLRERPHKAPPIKGKVAVTVPKVRMADTDPGHVTEPMVWQQLEALATPQVQRRTERAAISPPSMGAAVRFVVEDDLGQRKYRNTYIHSGACLVEVHKQSAVACDS